MTSLVDYILSLFRSEDAARSFVASPGQAMTNAGLVNVSPVEISSAAANALPFLNLGAGDPIGGLQQAVADQYGLASASEVGAASSYVAQDAGAVVAQDAAAVVSDAGVAAADAGFAGADIGASVANVVAADIGAGLASGLTSGLGAGLWSQSGLGWQTGVGGVVPGLAYTQATGDFGGQVGLASQVGLGFGAGIQAGFGAQASAGLG
ncbi:IniB N-terminal domain-containing protein, partial [Mycobacterium marinum]